MKKNHIYPILTIFFFLITTNAVYSMGRNLQKSRSEYLPGKILVKLKKATGTDAVSTLEKYAGKRFKRVFRKSGRPISDHYFNNIYRYEVDPDIDVFSACRELMNNPDVVYAEPDFIGHFCSTTPDDPDFPHQWYLNNTGQTGGTSDADVDAPEAWDLNRGDPEIVIAVIDTGVDYNHPDLTNNIWHNEDEIPENGVDDDGNGYIDDVIGWDFVSVPDYWVAEDEDAGPEDKDPMDKAGHGTYCTGPIASEGNNGTGISGMTWHCKIMPVRIGFKRPDGTSSFLASDAARGIRYAADNGAKVINLSWILRNPSSIISDAIKYAYSKGAIVIGAVGNDNAPGAVFPTSMEEVIAVAGTDDKDQRALWKLPQPPFPGEGSNFGSGIDVAAPGMDILTTNLDSGYISVSGTSISCALTSGLAALILSAHPQFSPLEVHDIIYSASDSELPSQEYIGRGRINAYKALSIDDVPVAEITSPGNNEMISGIVSLVGTAQGHTNTLANYVLEFGSGIYPVQWTLIADSSIPVENGTLATWNSGEVQDGKYTVRLTVFDSHGNYNIKEKTLFINKAVHPGWPENSNMDFIAHPVVADLDGDGTREIILGDKNGHLYVWKSNGELFLEKILDGSIVTSPVVSDIDLDGNPEIIVATDNEFSSPHCMVYILKNDGSTLEGWPKEVPGGNSLALAISDLDGDRKPEIVASTTRNYTAQKTIVYVWNTDGSNYNQNAWPKEIDLEYPPNMGTAQDFSSHPVLVDLDNDGDLEIIVAFPVYEKGTMYIWNHDGSNYANWPMETGDGYTVHSVSGDIDNDGKMEIIGIKKNGKIFVWNGDGSPYAPFGGSKTLPGTPSLPILADLDQNGDLEILLECNNGTIHAYHHDGQNVTGWPISVEATIGTREWPPMAVGDVDGDGIPEVVAAGGSNKKIYVWHSDGTSLEGWPKILPGQSYTSPIIGDMDKDGNVEILTTYDNSCLLWDLEGKYEKSSMEWPLFQHDARHTGTYSQLCKGDIDNDGDIDGMDLGLLVEMGSNSYRLKQLARGFGKSACPLYP